MTDKPHHIHLIFNDEEWSLIEAERLGLGRLYASRIAFVRYLILSGCDKLKNNREITKDFTCATDSTIV